MKLNTDMRNVWSSITLKLINGKFTVLNTVIFDNNSLRDNLQWKEELRNVAIRKYSNKGVCHIKTHTAVF